MSDDNGSLARASDQGVLEFDVPASRGTTGNIEFRAHRLLDKALAMRGQTHVWLESEGRFADITDAHLLDVAETRAGRDGGEWVIYRGLLLDALGLEAS